MFLPGQRVLYDLKPKHIGVVKGIELVKGTAGERVNYYINYSEYNIPVHAEGHLLRVAK